MFLSLLPLRKKPFLLDTLRGLPRADYHFFFLFFPISLCIFYVTFNLEIILVINLYDKNEYESANTCIFYYVKKLRIYNILMAILQVNVRYFFINPLLFSFQSNQKKTYPRSDAIDKYEKEKD